MQKNRRAIFYVTEFVRYSAGFAAIIALSLLTLHMASAAQ